MDDASLNYSDGRQSEVALKIQRGATRQLINAGYSCLSEISLPNARRADLICLHQDGHILIVEIKSSKQDYQVDQKWPEYKDYCDKFCFATHMEMDFELFPPEEGLLICDAYGGEFIRAPEGEKLSAARRKVIYQRMITQAAKRFHRLIDPKI